MKATAFLGLALLILGSATSTQGEIYKWVDPQGQIHFSDRPPEQGATTPIAVAPVSQPFSEAAERRQLGKIIPIYADDHLRIRLIHETDDLLVFDVEYEGMQELYPDINYVNVSLSVVTYDKESEKGQGTSYLTIGSGAIKEDAGSLVCKTASTKRTPSGYTTDTLQIFLHQEDFREKPGSYQLKKKIPFEKIWEQSAKGPDR